MRVERRQQPVDADRNPGRRHRLAGEPLDQIVIAAAARHRTELARPAVFAGDVECQFGLEDRAGVIAEPAHDRGIDKHACRVRALGGDQPGHPVEFVDPGACPVSDPPTRARNAASVAAPSAAPAPTKPRIRAAWSSDSPAPLV
jgi:hypothetical protein